MRSAFTLIELLVVITIIVVLLSLLAPALDQAIYAAEMARDAAQMRGISQATLGYASEYKRAYPNRDPNSSFDAMQIKHSTVFDIPRRLEAYVPPKMFIDPFLAEARLNVDECMRDPYGVFMPGYHVYLDWGRPNADPANADVVRMRRLGQKMIFRAPEGDTREFGIILADRDARNPDDWATSSHVDKEASQSLWAYQAGGNPWLVQGLGPAVGPATGNVYVAWWIGIPTRGLLDNHYAMDDGSVLRLDDVPLVRNLGDDERITFVPDVMELAQYNADRKTQLPRLN